MWDGYWSSNSLNDVKEWINIHSIPVVSIHTSGHSSTSDLKRFAESIRPRTIVPIHSFEPEKYSELFDNVKMYSDGEYWEV
jgi:ribonuclease J